MVENRKTWMHDTFTCGKRIHTGSMHSLAVIKIRGKDFSKYRIIIRSGLVGRSNPGHIPIYDQSTS
jgi:hypothetical protein